MDTGKGNFEILEETEGDQPANRRALEKRFPHHGGWFRVGEQIEIKGSLFRVKAVTPTKLILKLLPKPKGADLNR